MLLEILNKSNFCCKINNTEEIFPNKTIYMKIRRAVLAKLIIAQPLRAEHIKWGGSRISCLITKNNNNYK